MGISALNPPVYEASAVIPISIDYGRTQPLELLVEDRLLDRVWAYLTSKEVLQDAMDRMAQAGGTANPAPTWAELKNATRLEARLSRWHFVGSAESPEAAAAIANAWAAASEEALETALQHAWRAVELQDGVFFPNCIEVLQGPSQNELWECFSRGSQADSNQVEELRAEIEASHGVSPMISYDPVEEAEPPVHAVVRNRGWLVLAGAIAGLLAAAAAVLFAPPRL